MVHFALCGFINLRTIRSGLLRNTGHRNSSSLMRVSKCPLMTMTTNVVYLVLHRQMGFSQSTSSITFKFFFSCGKHLLKEAIHMKRVFSGCFGALESVVCNYLTFYRMILSLKSACYGYKKVSLDEVN